MILDTTIGEILLHDIGLLGNEYKFLKRRLFCISVLNLHSFGHKKPSDFHILIIMNTLKLDWTCLFFPAHLRNVENCGSIWEWEWCYSTVRCGEIFHDKKAADMKGEEMALVGRSKHYKHREHYEGPYLLVLTKQLLYFHGLVHTHSVHLFAILSLQAFLIVYCL